MSDIPRYRPLANDKYGITDDVDGKLCEYRDYARLKAEVERLRASSFVTAVPVEEYEKLKAEVERLKMEESKLLTLCETYEGDLERLRKAGDAMAKRTEFFQKRWDPDELCQEVEAWNAAKEGK